MSDSIDTTLRNFCDAVTQGNTAYLYGVLGRKAARKLARLREPQGLSERHTICQVLEKKLNKNEWTVKIQIGGTSHQHVLLTSWFCQGDHWIIDDSAEQWA